ncbi:CPBP family intramembrane metalloprotease [Mobilitalea sibirica]|uniref:CPBP family intramembrane metalloprotease n=1 Tax=Mobilitalea sibirica TaxID=1462919 RepID=A0A8J7H1Q1_9FIRM|nr:type II CAAX endopeptidase family protein [Mobilitalea sibirica]MBH1940454.1 CPBP family intramembrane metalloprotease [Mobilitalea sibirica]
MRYFIKVFEGITPFFAALGLQGLAYQVLTAIYQFYIRLTVEAELKGQGITDSDLIRMRVENRAMISPELKNLFGIFIMIFCGIIFVQWYRRININNPKRRIGSIFSFSNTGNLILIGLGCQFFISALLNVLLPFFTKLFEEYSEIMNSIFVGHPIMIVIYSVIIAPIVEEMIFRGVMLNKLRQSFPFIGANILQAIIFGVYHTNIIQGIYAFANGILLGYICYKFQSILASIFLHMVINAAAYIYILYPGDMPINMYLGLGVIGGITISFGLYRLKEDKID